MESSPLVEGIRYKLEVTYENDRVIFQGFIGGRKNFMNFLKKLFLFSFFATGLLFGLIFLISPLLFMAMKILIYLP